MCFPGCDTCGLGACWVQRRPVFLWHLQGGLQRRDGVTTDCVSTSQARKGGAVVQAEVED